MAFNLGSLFGPFLGSAVNQPRVSPTPLPATMGSTIARTFGGAPMITNEPGAFTPPGGRLIGGAPIPTLGNSPSIMNEPGAFTPPGLVGRPFPGQGAPVASGFLARRLVRKGLA